MKLILDTTVCQGYGLCQVAAPDLVDPTTPATPS